MQKIKIDRYLVPAKGRTYEVLKFPFVRHMWVYEGHDGYFVDGSEEAHRFLCYAFAILADYPDKLVYFPCKQERFGDYYQENYNLALCRPELQLRRSLWPEIRGKLDKKHSAGKFCFCYNGKKLMDYYEKGLRQHYRMEDCLWNGGKRLPRYAYFKMRRECREEVVGDTFFLVSGRTECYDIHYDTALTLADICGEEYDQCAAGMGWVMSEPWIHTLCPDTERDE